MLKRRFLLTLAALTLCLPGGLTGQDFEDGYSMGPSARPYGATESSTVDTDYFEYDAQLWAPWDVTTLDGSPRLNTGFYAELGFAYFSVSRPGAFSGQDPRQFNTGNDNHWAREIELGYMSTKDEGWGLGWLDLEGSVFPNGQDVMIQRPTLLRTTFDVFQLNRHFRQRLSNGGWIEPYIGMRYTQLTDHTIQDGITGFPIDLRFQQKVSNSALGGHIGSRYFREFGRFRVGGDLALGTMYNSQRYFASTYIFNPTTQALFSNNEITNEGNDLLPLLDLSLRLNYAVTRDISLRGGVGILYMWEGMARADTRLPSVNPNSSFSGLPAPRGVEDFDFIAAGFTFGVDWKR